MCGIPELDHYLQHQASQDYKRSLSQTFVLTVAANDADILGYYTLSSYSIAVAALPPDLRKHLPPNRPLPTTLLGRFAIHASQQGRGLGTLLLYHAMRRALRATKAIASFGIVVDAMNDAVVPFYRDSGFIELQDKPRHLIAPISHLRALFPEDAAAMPSSEPL